MKSRGVMSNGAAQSFENMTVFGLRTSLKVRVPAAWIVYYHVRDTAGR
jgi:hypothetical protein